MKAIFNTNDKSESTYPLLTVAINSLQANTTLIPYVIWSGSMDHPMVNWLISKNVNIVNHELSFKNDIKHFNFNKVDYTNKLLGNMYKHYKEYYNSNFIEMDSIRIDIPLLFDDNYVMYVDCDVIFLKDIKLEPFSEPLAAVLRQPENFFNNGVMILNLSELQKDLASFLRFYKDSNYSFKIGNNTTQGAYNTFYKDRVHGLSKDMNHFVFNGINHDAQIVHFAGPKPWDYKIMQKELTILSSELTYEKMYYNYLQIGNASGSIQYYLKEWYKYA